MPEEAQRPTPTSGDGGYRSDPIFHSDGGFGEGGSRGIMNPGQPEPPKPITPTQPPSTPKGNQ